MQDHIWNAPIPTEIKSGLVYRNPMPHVKSQHAYFPSVVSMDNGELLASVVLGEAFEAVNLDTYVLRSKDQGETWSEIKPMLPADFRVLASNCGRLTALPGGEVVSMVVKSLRHEHPEMGLANPENIGFVPTEVYLVRSKDYGYTWESPKRVLAPLDGPAFEACSAIVVLNDGRWIWPTSTWRSWDGVDHGMKMIAWISYDQGATWPAYMDIMDESTQQVINWEGKVLELKNGEYVAVSWAFDERQGKDKNNQFVYSGNQGATWTPPTATSIQGQTMSIAEMPDGRLICVFRRMDKPGLWCSISRIESGPNGGEWYNDSEFCVWGSQENVLNQKSGDMVQDFNELKFGAPQISVWEDGTVFIIFWCYEKMVSNVRWIKLKF
jgi:sialidase-1